MSEPVSLTLHDEVALVRIDNPPVNALSEPVIDGLADATCAQVEYWLTGDEEDDILGPTQGAAIGGMQQQYGAGENRVTPMYLAPRAARHLRRAGLLSASVGS